MYIKIEHSADGRRWADLSPAQLRLALGSARPTTMASVNAKARAWAQAQGFDGHVGWTIADLEEAQLAVKTLKGKRRRARKGGTVTVGRFRWVDQKTDRLQV